MYRIMIKHTTSSSSVMADKMYEVYGSEVTSKNATGTTSVFTPFETDDVEILKAEVLKLDRVYGHKNIMVCQIVELAYDVEIISDETDTEKAPTEPDISTDNTTTDDENIGAD